MVVLLVLLVLVCRVVAESVPVYGKFETCVQLEKQYHNPFNYSEVLVQGAFSGPQGKDVVDGFYYQDFIRSWEGGQEQLSPKGPRQWCVRYSPRNTGSYAVTLTVTDNTGTATIHNTSFQAVQASNPRGFIHLAKNGVHFQFDNGSTYYPIGENVCWVTMQNGTYDYDMYLSKLAAVGANYVRLWLTDSSWDDLAVEMAVANYSLPNTWRLDYVVELAQSRGIYLLMCTESFNYFCTNPAAPCNWNKDCYYNRKFGGFLDRPQDFFTDAEARADYQQRLRYLVARYGYSTSVFAWEFFNEVDLTDAYQSSVQTNWNRDMASYLHSVDMYGHLISTSFSNSDGDHNVQALSELDFTMTHNYGASDIAQQTAQYPYKKLLLYKKPSYVAEYGIGDESQDKTGVSLHNGLWAPLFSLAAGTCMTWWWDSWVEPNHLYPIFQPFSRFVSQLPLADFTWSKADASSNTTSDECYRWPAQHEGKQCLQRSGINVIITGCHGGSSYSSEWYSPREGVVVARGRASCSEGKLGRLVDLAPPFTGDLAVLYSTSS